MLDVVLHKYKKASPEKWREQLGVEPVIFEPQNNFRLLLIANFCF